MGKEHILVIEDEEDILALIHYNLAREGYSVSSRTSGEEGLSTACSEEPDLVVLDLMLPGIDGHEVCRRLKADQKTAGIPIVMLTAKGEEADVVAGLEQGADDYVTKPFSTKVFLARVQAVLRRREREREAADEAGIVEIHGLSIHPGRNEVRAEGMPVDLTYTEFRVLLLLAGRPGWVFTRNQIMDAVRGEDYAVTERAVDVQIVGLRKKLGPCGKNIETVRGVGYRFKE
ncbi:MAG: DNA-binding response regulator [Desulfuromonas sp.]|uniref:response regulator transcription factor n=1 Tax=Desulfuromonas sp. TaxID=892 RepID=UPI000CBBB412|nr:response regulator transcription factor [Desulfuromonas sp.]PLX83972.1 MAG: DNA-binding response regulator [Desulfuromonas sp.]